MKDIEKYIVENKDKFYRLAYSYTNSQEDALDVVSESILKMYEYSNKMRNKDAMKTWGYRIIVNTALDLLRKRKKVIPLTEEIMELDIGEEDLYRDFDLRDAIEHLPEKYKTIIVLRFFEDLKIEEISEILKENTSTIKTRLYAALKKLRIELSPQDI